MLEIALYDAMGKAPQVPVMADESLFTLEDAYALARAQAVDAFCIKLYGVGGLTPAGRRGGCSAPASSGSA